MGLCGNLGHEEAGELGRLSKRLVGPSGFEPETSCIPILRTMLTIHYADNQLTFWDSDQLPDNSAGSRVQLLRAEQGYSVPVSFNGSLRSWLLVDTGSNITHIQWSVWRRLLKTWQPARMIVAPRLVGQDQARAYLTRLESLQVGNYMVDKPVVRVEKPGGKGAFAQLDAPGVLGNDLLRRFIVTLDLVHRQLFLEADPHYQPDPLRFTTVGIQLRRKGKFFLVDSVWEGSPAHQAQIEAGDKILEIDNLKISTLSGKEVQRRLHGPEGSSVALRLRRGDEILIRKVERRNLL